MHDFGSMQSTMNVRIANHHVASWLIGACGVWLVGLGLYFIVVRPPLLPEDARSMGATIAHIHAAVPGLDGWLKKVFIVMGGFMAGAGVLTVFVATVAMPSRLNGTSWAIALAGAPTLALMSATNFALDSDFKWLLLVPAAIWLAGLVLHVMGRRNQPSAREMRVAGRLQAMEAGRSTKEPS